MNADKDPDVVFRSTLYLMDIERVRFSLSRYLRTRLKKIETQVAHIIGNAEALDRLWARERDFAFELHALNERYVGESLLERLSVRQTAEVESDIGRHAMPQLQVGPERFCWHFYCCWTLTIVVLR